MGSFHGEIVLSAVPGDSALGQCHFWLLSKNDIDASLVCEVLKFTYDTKIYQASMIHQTAILKTTEKKWRQQD